MKIEMCDVTGVTIGWCVTAVALIVLAVHGCSVCERSSVEKHKASVSAGLVQVPDSAATTHWAKP